MKIYYVVTVGGIPELVTSNPLRARQMAEEMTTSQREAQVIPCIEMPEGTQTELPIGPSL